MKKIFFLALVVLGMTSCKNEHIRFVNGVVVAEERSLVGVSVAVDTIGNGIPNFWATVSGTEMLHNFTKGDSVTVDLREWEHFANLLLKQEEKSKQDITEE